MGWDITYGSTLKQLKTRLKEGAEARGFKTLAQATKGTVWYRALEEVATGKKFIAVYLTKSGKGYAGYKPMTEDMGPLYFNCPLKLLELTEGGPKSRMAEEWRREVREYWRKQEAKKAAKLEETLNDFNYVGSPSHY